MRWISAVNEAQDLLAQIHMQSDCHAVERASIYQLVAGLSAPATGDLWT
jgi:hypothetical protein